MGWAKTRHPIHTGAQQLLTDCSPNHPKKMALDTVKISAL